MNFSSQRVRTFMLWGLKLSLSFAFLSAVADRLGLWGSAGTDGVFWGNFENFIAYTKILAPWCPESLLFVLSWIVTILEVVLGLLLVTNLKTKYVALASGILLVVFGISMVVTVGPKAALDYSVFSGAFGALYLFSSIGPVAENNT